jgi:gas vesicle protein
MNRITGLVVGLTVGALIGVGLAIVFAPQSGRALRGHLREGYREAQASARAAGETERIALRTRYTLLTGKPLSTPTPR